MVIAGVATRFQVLQKTMGRWISVLTIINTFLLRLQPLSLVMDHTSLKNSICPINLGHNMFYNGLSVVSALACCWCPLVTPYHIRGCFLFFLFCSFKTKMTALETSKWDFRNRWHHCSSVHLLYGPGHWLNLQYRRNKYFTHELMWMVLFSNLEKQTNKNLLNIFALP